MARHFRDLVMEVREARAFIDSSGAFWAKTVTSAVDAGKCDEDARRAAKGGYLGTLADAGLPPNAAESIVDKATSMLARLLASESPLSMLEGGGGGRRLALAGRRLETPCVLVNELVGLEDRRLGGRCRPRQME